MNHFAQFDESDIVVRVIVAEQDLINSGLVGDPKSWVQTSYSGAFRRRFAGSGFRYDRDRDAFIAPKPNESCVLDEATLN